MKEGILVKGINAGYDKKNVLNNICITAEMVKVTAVVGPNGSGKSTL